MITRRGLLTAGVGALAGTAWAQTGDGDTSRWPVFEAATGATLTWPALASRLATSFDAVFVGEQHDDPQTHRAEAALLRVVHATVGSRLSLGMEMFERDGQAALTDYLAHRITEADLGKRVKLWPNYATDYRPLVEYARAHDLPVLATNAPARLVRLIGKDGLAAAFAHLTPTDRALVARTVYAPDLNGDDAYARRFAAIIADGHGDGKPMDAATVRRFFEAQCLRDDTMAETVANALGAGRYVFHVNGGFHSESGGGVVQRLQWRLPLAARRRVAVVGIIPTKSRPDPAAHRPDADYLIFVPDTRKD